MFQAFNLFPHMSVLDNVTLAPRRVLKTPRRDAEAAATELLARFGLADKRARVSRTGCRAASSSAWRSSGRWRCSPTCCSSTRSRAPSTRSSWPRCSSVIRELAAGGMTMLIATHEMGFAREIANRVCFLDEGVDPRGGSARSSSSATRASRGPASSSSGSSRRRPPLTGRRGPSVAVTRGRSSPRRSPCRGPAAGPSRSRCGSGRSSGSRGRATGSGPGSSTRGCAPSCRCALAIDVERVAGLDDIARERRQRRGGRADERRRRRGAGRTAVGVAVGAGDAAPLGPGSRLARPTGCGTHAATTASVIATSDDASRERRDDGADAVIAAPIVTAVAPDRASAAPAQPAAAASESTGVGACSANSAARAEALGRAWRPGRGRCAWRRSRHGRRPAGRRAAVAPSIGKVATPIDAVTGPPEALTAAGARVRRRCHEPGGVGTAAAGRRTRRRRSGTRGRSSRPATGSAPRRSGAGASSPAWWPQRVVDLPEVVEVEHDQAERRRPRGRAARGTPRTCRG